MFTFCVSRCNDYIVVTFYVHSVRTVSLFMYVVFVSSLLLYFRYSLLMVTDISIVRET